MLFLIDYENTDSSGLIGTQWLEPDDDLLLFWSPHNPGIEKQALDDILSSGCRFQAYKLEKTGKNALDFWITSELGNRFGAGYTGQAAIISKDAGFKAVRDFWIKAAGSRRCVHFCPSIEKAIIMANFNDRRTRELHAMRGRQSIEHAWNEYRHTRKICEPLLPAFREAGLAGLTAKAALIKEQADTPAACYRACLKEFGRAEGTAAYRLLKEIKD